MLCLVNVFKSIPSTRIYPSQISLNPYKIWKKEDLPAPVLPTTATFSLAFMENERFWRAGSR